MDHRPVGKAIEGFTTAPLPGPPVIEGRYMQLERLDPARHSDPLFAAAAGHDWIWDYMGAEPFADKDAFRRWNEAWAQKTDPYFYAIREATSGQVQGMASYLRIEPGHGVIEIGHILMTPPLQRTAAATEAISALIGWAFDHGYRRVEWKCDSLNAPSMAAARRFGFTYEGTFRQHMIYKGRNRDTAWWAITDTEWPKIRSGHQAWLAKDNFDAAGSQIKPLGHFMPSKTG